MFVLTAVAAALLSTSPPACRVEVRSAPPQDFQRRVVVTVKPGCPPGGVAHVRLASKLGGHLPDDPPGTYVLHPGEQLRRTVLKWWRVEWRSASGKAFYPVREEAP